MQIKLDPDAAAVLNAFREAGRPPYETLKPDESRALYRAGSAAARPEAPPLASVDPLTIQGPASPIQARIYNPLAPRQTDGLAPCLVFFHGGGWVIGDLDTHDAVCRTLADAGKLIVVSVDYRLAPENKFPAGVEDAIASTEWLAKNGRTLGIDTTHVMLAGDSAGGNLAAVVALDARNKGPKISGLVLIYPATDFALTHASHNDPATDALLTRSAIRFFRDLYLNDLSEVDDWKASPARTRGSFGIAADIRAHGGGRPVAGRR